MSCTNIEQVTMDNWDNCPSTPEGQGTTQTQVPDAPEKSSSPPTPTTPLFIDNDSKILNNTGKKRTRYQ